MFLSELLPHGVSHRVAPRYLDTSGFPLDSMLMQFDSNLLKTKNYCTIETGLFYFIVRHG